MGGVVSSPWEVRKTPNDPTRRTTLAHVGEFRARVAKRYGFAPVATRGYTVAYGAGAKVADAGRQLDG